MPTTYKRDFVSLYAKKENTIRKDIDKIAISFDKGLCKNKLYKYEKKCYTMRYG